ncbi:MAG: hypothetical protein Kapaf2KO_04580 [Candidatus Kapaibacteriales bacterium]
MIVLSVSALIVGCGSKAGSNQSSDLYKSFYVGQNVNQYFIKPLTFENDSGDLIADFTFKITESGTDSTTINYTILSDDIIKSLDSLTLSNSTISIPFTVKERFFLERDGDQYRVRFSSLLPNSDFFTLFQDSNWEVTTYNSGKSANYKSDGDTKDKIQELKKDLILLVD